MHQTRRLGRPPKAPTPSHLLGNSCAAHVGIPITRCAQPTGGLSDACPQHRPVSAEQLTTAAVWFASGQHSTPTQVPDVPWSSLAGIAHTAGRTREDVDPTDLVRRWFEIAAAAGPRDQAPGVWAGAAS